jgi:hypothetical protein
VSVNNSHTGLRGADEVNTVSWRSLEVLGSHMIPQHTPFLGSWVGVCIWGLGLDSLGLVD